MRDKLNSLKNILSRRFAIDEFRFYFYPCSGNDLTPLLLLPATNRLNAKLFSADELVNLNESVSSKETVLFPVLIDIMSIIADSSLQDWFNAQPYPELWTQFQTRFSVNLIDQLQDDVWLFEIELIRNNTLPSKHPFLFMRRNAHKLVTHINKDISQTWWLALIRCSGFSGGPSGECSFTLSRQVANLQSMHKPQLVICDEYARRDFLEFNEDTYQLETGRSIAEWGWGRTKVFRLRIEPKL